MVMVGYGPEWPGATHWLPIGGLLLDASKFYRSVSLRQRLYQVLRLAYLDMSSLC